MMIYITGNFEISQFYSFSKLKFNIKILKGRLNFMQK